MLSRDGRTEQSEPALTRDLDLAGLDLILNGQEPLFEARAQSSKNKASWFTSASELLDSGLDYFGPVARRRRHQVRGFSKADVAETTNVVWVDFDPPADADLSTLAPLVERAERNVDGLIALGLMPSVAIFSGRGHWCYWKLARHIGQDEAEALMRRLYAQFRREGSERDIGRIARLPGSVNEKTGFSSFVMSVSGVVWEPEELAELLPDLEDQAESVARSEVNFDPSLKPGGKLPVIELPDGLLLYLTEKPSKRERKKRGIDGSAREQSIINRLVNQGYTDAQIALFFDHHDLPRHMAEKARRHGSYSWLARSIAVSRARLGSSLSLSLSLSSPPTVSIGNGTYSGDEEQEPDKPRQLNWSGRRWWMLRDLPEGKKKSEVVVWVKETYGVERSQALRDLDWLEKEEMVEQRQDKADRRIRRVYRTRRANELLAKRVKTGAPISFLKGLPTNTSAATGTTPAKKPTPTKTQAKSKSKSKSTPGSRDREEQLRRAEIRRRQRALINDVYRLHIPGRTWTYFQSITPIREWRKVLLHEQLPVTQDDIGFVYESFISPRDEALGDPAAHDHIEERTLLNEGWPARIKYIGLVAEAVLAGGGFAVAEYQRDGVSVSRVGLIVQAKSNFYDKLRSRDTGVISVRKRGQRRDTSYEFERYTNTITIPTHSLDLDAIIEELADPDRASTNLKQASVYALPGSGSVGRRRFRA
jgi:DNA-binding MarR family transcriptional regulator